MVAGRRARVLVVGDDVDVSDVMVARLLAEGFEVVSALSGEDALDIVGRGPLDLVILDQGLPGMSGTETCRSIRERRGHSLPIIFVSGHAAVEDRLEGFSSGADDYIVKPVDSRELVMRTRAVLRRSAQDSEPGEAGEHTGPQGLRLLVPARQLCVGDAEVPCTATEFQVMRELLAHRGDVRSADQISQAVWGYETSGARNYLEAQISRLRSKLAARGVRDAIETVRGFGYVIR